MSPADEQSRALDSDVVLVTGAAGFIGGALYALLRARGVSVVGMDRTGSPAEAPIVECDVTDIHRLHHLFVTHRPTVIVHCGAYSGPMVARDNPHAIASVNIGGTVNLLEAARIHGLRRMVFLSSNTVYGTHTDPISEDAPLEPTNVYGATKVAGEKLVNAYTRRYGVEGVSLRVSAVYGPGRRTHCYIRSLIENAVNNKPTVLPFGADFPRQYVHIDDAVDAISRAIYTPVIRAPAYNIAGAECVTMADIAEIAYRVVPNLEADLKPGVDPDDDDRQGPMNITAAHTDLGFTPRTRLDNGIRSYAEWMSAGELLI